MHQLTPFKILEEQQTTQKPVTGDLYIIYCKPYCTDWQFSSGYLHEPIQHVDLSKKLLQAPGEAFGTALFWVLEVVAGVPGEGGLDAGFLQQGVLLFDAGADGAHDGVAGLVFAVAEAQIDDACL